MREGKCRYCGQEGLWSWAYYKKSSVLVANNQVHKCNSRDIFPGWCEQCKRTDLLLVRKTEYSFQLTENYGLPHTCAENGQTDIEDMSEAKCKHCSTTELFWVKERNRWRIVNATGEKHVCEEYPIYMKAWAEALRMDYAFQKAWLKSKPDESQCKRCKGKGERTFQSRDKRLMQKYSSSEPITVFRLCRHCKHIGTFSPERKKSYLKSLREKYWPYYSGVHKWKKAGVCD